MGHERREWVDASALHDLEPALAPAMGAVLHRHDGAVDSAALLNAVRVDAEQERRITFREDRVVRLMTGRPLICLELASGERVEGPSIVLAAGAWVSLIAGLPRALPVVPVRGQVLALAGAPVRHVVIARRGYLVSRHNRSLVGSTMERVGFDARTTVGGAALLREYAREISPALAARPTVDHRAGLRPVTPDLLPVVGADPECEGLFYACGHSRNGVLLAPLTARVIAELVSTGTCSIDIKAYAPARFRM
jgi:glycine oxidase